MAKKKAIDLVELAERAIRKALDETLGAVQPEAAYVDQALSALDLVVEGLKMRQQELEQEED